MSANDKTCDKTNVVDWLENLPCIQIVHSFRTAAQPGKLLLGIIAAVTIFLTGWIMDTLTPMSMRAPGPITISQNLTSPTAVSLHEFAAPRLPDGRPIPIHYRRTNDADARATVHAALMAAPLNMTGEQALETIDTGAAPGKLRAALKDQIAATAKRLKNWYEEQSDSINADNSNDAGARKHQLAQLKETYHDLFAAITGQPYELDNYAAGLNQLGAERKTLVSDTVDLQQAYDIAQQAQGRGIFATFVNFNMRRFHMAVLGLVKDHDLQVVVAHIFASVHSVRWLFTYHWIFATIFLIASFAICAIVGGAISRMAALQIARDERIGAIRALAFSIRKFYSFFAAPFIPIIVMLIITLVMFLISLIGCVPYFGELLAAVLMGLALVGGFVMAFITVLLIGGGALMTPAIATEGSDAFDAFSRAFSYVYERPWRTLFYIVLACLYGTFCYVFVRFFVFLLLVMVNVSVGAAINSVDAAAVADVGKYSALWPMPQFSNLYVAPNWISLNWSETIAAGVIWVWVALMIAVVIAFVVSYFYSVSTTIYFLLRQRVDGTDIEDVYVEESIEDLAPLATAQAAQPAPNQEETIPTESEPEAKPQGEDDTYTKDY